MRRVLTVFAALALLLVACGGSGTSTDTTASPTATAELPPTTSTTEPPETSTPAPDTSPAATPFPPAPVTTGKDFPQVLSRDLIPWGEVGPGWYLLAYDPSGTSPLESSRGSPPPAPPTPLTILYLVDGRDAAGLYEVAAIDGVATIADWRLDGSAALVWTRPDRSQPSGELLLVDIASGEAQQLAGDHLLDDRGYGNPALAFTTPQGLHLVARTDDGVTETLAYYDFAGNQLQELFQQPIIPFPSPEQQVMVNLDWLYGPDGIDLVVSHAQGLSLVTNDGTVIRDLWMPEVASYCQPVRWWSEGVFLGACRGVPPDFPHGFYHQLWLLRTDGTPGEAITEVTNEEVGYWDYGYFDAWPTENGTLLQTGGDAGSYGIVFVQDRQTQPIANVFSTGQRLVDVSVGRAAINAAGPEPGGAFYIFDLQAGEADVIIPQIENTTGVTSAFGLATAVLAETELLVLDASAWVGRQFSIDDWTWGDRVVVDGQTEDLYASNPYSVPWDGEYRAGSEYVIVASKPEAIFSDVYRERDLMVWVYDDEGIVLDAIGVRLPPGIKLGGCWQVNPAGASWPAVVFTASRGDAPTDEDLAWFIMPPLEYFNPIDPQTIDCSAG